MEYLDFLKSKQISSQSVGFDVAEKDLHPALFDFQRDIVRWGLKRGRAALFEGCGLGKSIQQLVWGHHVTAHTQAKGLLLAPLSVTDQTLREAEKFDIKAKIVTRQSECEIGINIANYQKLHHFDTEEFAFIIPDESSIIKGFDSATRNVLIAGFKHTPYRLANTATPAPNDWDELGNHAEFLGIMSLAEMRAMFFTHDGSDTSKWILKPHAQEAFWKWVCTWAVMIRQPSDLGYDDGDFKLPPLIMHHHSVDVDILPQDGALFMPEARSMQERRNARKVSIDDRVAACAAIVNASDEPWLIWCSLNAEGDAIESAISDAVQVAGSDNDEFKQKTSLDFIEGRTRVMISKPRIFGYGLNYQHCPNVAFVGLSDSWEDYYQAIRRCWRFGQTKTVNCHVITSTAEGAVVKNIERKERDAATMTTEIIRHMRATMEKEIRGASYEEIEYNPTITMRLPVFLEGIIS